MMEPIQVCQKASSSSCSYFWNIFPACLFLSWCVSYYRCTSAAGAHFHCLAKPWVFSQPRSGRNGKCRGKWGRRVSQQGFMTSKTICIIVCISCSVNTQCQHGWSVLISKLHHKDKRNTYRYKVILLLAVHVKLFRRTQQAGGCSSCMNGPFIASWFLKAKRQILNALCITLAFTDLLI